jgi:hypothetical protein
MKQLFEGEEGVGVNVANASTEGHYVTKHQAVYEIDSLNEQFLVEVPEGETALMQSKNHSDLEIAESGMVDCQKIYNPDVSGQMQKYRLSRD